MILRLLSGAPTKKPDYYQLYHDAYIRKYRMCINNPDNQAVKSLIFYGVRYINTMKRTGNESLDELSVVLEIIEKIKEQISWLTPAELLNVFPLDKRYDGERYQSKDYFSSMEMLQKFEMDKPIGDKIDDLLWDYMNIQTRLFVAQEIGILSDIQQVYGEPGIMEEFATKNGITTFTKYTELSGKEFIVNNQTGKSIGFKKKIPRYLKLI
ncbi:MAG TPA: hypothetical protein DDW50_21090 [Firmicutes bacterium]|jgi:hypothetical protein|nr:hypothetical protein [Bacillota bacterium]